MNSVISRGRRAGKKAEKAARSRRKTPKPVLAALALPEDVTGDAARLIVLGSARLLAENIRGVAEVTRTRVRLTTAQGIVGISGEALALADAREGALCVCGRITRIDLPVPLEAAHD